MRIAMIHRDLSVPPRAGAHLRMIKMATELQRRGHEIHYFCFEADQQAPLPFQVNLIRPAPADEAEAWIKESRLVRSLMRYWATTPGDMLGLHRVLERLNCEVVLTAGLHGLLYLRFAQASIRIWYPADEMFIAALGQLRFSNTFAQNRLLLGEAVRLLLFQRMCRNVPDETWVVARKDLRSMQRMLGRREVYWIPNGVDFDYFSPVPVEVIPYSAVFWGRLDFGPNEQALDFFLGKVWPLVRAAESRARLILMGYSPSETVRRLAAAPGVELHPNVPDLRSMACSAPVAIHPFVSGTGVKNKLLEGAALARALVVTPTAVDGMRVSGQPPWRVCTSPEAWRDALLDLWRRPDEAAALGAAARSWVEQNHSWQTAGALAEESFARVLARRRHGQ